ncbi:MAG: DnaB-like helicase C-terminal domain-containing protein [Pseudomonadota bacterium]
MQTISSQIRPLAPEEDEKIILGTYLSHTERRDEIASRIATGDFLSKINRQIFRKLCKYQRHDATYPDAAALMERLRTQLRSHAGIVSYISVLIADFSDAARLDSAINTVLKLSAQRQLMNIGEQFKRNAAAGNAARLFCVMNEAAYLIDSMKKSGSQQTSALIEVKDLVLDEVDRIEKQCGKDAGMTGVSTGFTDIDDLTGGLRGSELVVLAGRPSMGKTTLALNIVLHSAVKNNVPTAIFFSTGSATLLVRRMLSALGRIDQSDIRTGALQEEDRLKLETIVSELSQAPLFISDAANVTISELSVRARALCREKGLGLLIIDDLEGLRIPGLTHGSEDHSRELLAALKILAKDLDIPVLALSRLNRSLERRSDKRPMLSDIYGSSAIERLADTILFLYRDEVYEEDSPAKGTAEIIIAKQANGPAGIRILAFKPEYALFMDYDDTYHHAIV